MASRSWTTVRRGLAATSINAPPDPGGTWDNRRWRVCVGVAGIDIAWCSPGGVKEDLRLSPDPERRDATDPEEPFLSEAVSYSSLSLCDLTSSDARLRTSTAVSFSASIWIVSNRDRTCLTFKELLPLPMPNISASQASRMLRTRRRRLSLTTAFLWHSL